MADLPTTTLLVGLAVALARAIEWLAKAVLQKRNGSNGNGARSAGRTAGEWDAKLKELAKTGMREYCESQDFRETMKDIIEDLK